MAEIDVQLVKDSVRRVMKLASLSGDDFEVGSPEVNSEGSVFVEVKGCIHSDFNDPVLIKYYPPDARYTGKHYPPNGKGIQMVVILFTNRMKIGGHLTQQDVFCDYVEGENEIKDYYWSRSHFGTFGPEDKDFRKQYSTFKDFLDDDDDDYNDL